MRKIISAFICFLYLTTNGAMAITPASAEQILCSNDLILVGTVISGIPLECLETNGQPKNCNANTNESRKLLLEIEVRKVISHTKPEHYRLASAAMPKHMIPLPSDLREARLEEYLKDKEPRKFLDSTYRPGDINEFLVGHEFIFGLHHTQGEPGLRVNTLHQSSAELEILDILKSSKIDNCIKVD